MPAWAVRTRCIIAPVFPCACLSRCAPSLLHRYEETLRVEIGAALWCRFLFDNRNAIGIGKRIVADACYLPRDFDVWLVRLDLKAIVLDFARDNRLCKLPDDCQLITKVAV